MFKKISILSLLLFFFTGCALVDIPADPIVDTAVYEQSADAVAGEIDYSDNSEEEENSQEEEVYTQRHYEQTPQNDIDYYTNVNGKTVQSPTYYYSAPVGASATCNDGTYSFSQNRRGTCSGHGGVASWL